MATPTTYQNSDGLTDINVTPLVDVFLVLLIIVLVSAHLLDHKVLQVELPASTQSTPVPASLEITLDAHGQFYVGDQSIARKSIASHLRQLAQQNPHRPVLISVDANQPYREVIALFDLARASGLQRAALKLGGQS
jgi:biopolymer transport protein ExbD